MIAEKQNHGKRIKGLYRNVLLQVLEYVRLYILTLAKLMFALIREIFEPI